MSGKARPKWLAELIGEGNADATRKGLRAAADKLDELGVERKDLMEQLYALNEQANRLGAKELSWMVAIPDAVLDKAASRLATAVKGADDDAKIEDVLRDELLEALGVDEEESAGEPAAESDEDAEAVEEPDEEDADALVKSVVKAITDQADAMREDVGEIGKAQLAQAKQLGDLTKALEKVNGRLGAVEEATKGRPRQASKAAETVLEGEDDTIAQLKKTLEKELNGNKTFMGLAVTDDPE